jgi:hypothetical protein
MGKLDPQNEIDYLRKASKKVADKNRLRSNYPTTIDLLKSGLANEDIFIGLYETIFRLKELNRLCNYLYIKKKTNTGKRINASPVPTTTPEVVLIKKRNPLRSVD